MKKEIVMRGFVWFSVFAIVAIAFLFIFFFPKSPATGHFVQYGTGPFYYNCSSCSDCSDAILNATEGDTIFLDSPISASGICINISDKRDITFDCMNNSIIGPGTGTVYGIFLYNTTNSHIKNCGISLTSVGVYLINSAGNSLTNIVTASSSGAGILLYMSNNTALNQIYSLSNAWGIYISSSIGNTFTTIIADSNSYGMSFINSFNSDISNSDITNSRIVGINITLSDYNTFTNIDIINDSTGAFFTSSDYNTLKNSHIEKNNYGLSFSSSQSNLIYNNLFNNTNNYYSSNCYGIEYFNTTKTSATNIIGKSYTGGNFWATPSKTGFSENCTSDSDSDKICDTPYTICNPSSDHLPLIYNNISISTTNTTTPNCTELWNCTAWSSCVNWNKTRTCSDYNSCGTNASKPSLIQSCTAICTESWTCTNWGACVNGNQTRICTEMNGCGTTSNKPSLSQTCTATNNTGALGTEGIGTNVTKSLTSLTPSSPGIVNIDDSQIYLTRITLNVKESIQSASVTVTKVNVLANATLAAGLPDGQFYQAFKIETSMASSDIEDVTIEFKVNKAWLTSKSGSSSGIKLYRRPDTSSNWNSLTTSLAREDSTYYYFTSTSPGFSTFAVFFKPCTGSECQGISAGRILLYVAIGLVAVGIGVTAFFLFRKLKNKQEE